MRIDQITGLGQDALDGPADLCTPRVGNDAKGAKLVAALLHGEECGRPPLCLGTGGEVGEFVFLGEVGVDNLFTPPGARFHLWQTVVALRTDDQIDHWLAAHDLRALGLRNTTGDTDLEVRLGLLQLLVAAQLRVNLFRRAFPDVARIKKDHIRFFG